MNVKAPVCVTQMPLALTAMVATVASVMMGFSEMELFAIVSGASKHTLTHNY